MRPILKIIALLAVAAASLACLPALALAQGDPEWNDTEDNWRGWPPGNRDPRRMDQDRTDAKRLGQQVPPAHAPAPDPYRPSTPPAGQTPPRRIEIPASPQ